jgi:hypothetical protein
MAGLMDVAELSVPLLTDEKVRNLEVEAQTFNLNTPKWRSWRAFRLSIIACCVFIILLRFIPWSSNCNMPIKLPEPQTVLQNRVSLPILYLHVIAYLICLGLVGQTLIIRRRRANYVYEWRVPSFQVLPLVFVFSSFSNVLDFLFLDFGLMFFRK